MLVKGTPTQKRKIPTTLASFHNANPHIDLLAFVYENVTEQKFCTEFIEEEGTEHGLGNELYTLIDTIRNQLGVEKYLEVIIFIAKIKKKYVTDLRKNKIATTEMLVFFDSTGKSIVSGSFDCLLILKELQVFVPEENVLKRMLEEARKKNVKFVNS